MPVHTACSGVINASLQKEALKTIMMKQQNKETALPPATYIKAQGAYSGRDKHIIMTIINNIQLKKLESIVFEVDNDALFIVEDSFNVLGSNFGKRKIY